MEKLVPDPATGVAGLVRAFRGMVVQSPVNGLLAASGVSNPDQLWLPRSREDVALALAGIRNRKLFIRSGRQAAVPDLDNADGGVLLDLAELDAVTVSDGVVNAEAGATAGKIADRLAKLQLALPLAANPQQSIAAGILQSGPSCLMRTLGPLSEYVAQLNTVSRPAGRSDAPAAPGDAIVTDIDFRPAPAENLWMTRWAFPYPGKESFTTFAASLFSRQAIIDHCDLVLDAFSAWHDLPMVRVTAAGKSEGNKKSIIALVENALEHLPPEHANEVRTQSLSGGAVVAAVVDREFVIPPDRQIDTHRMHQIVEPRFVRQCLNQAGAEIERAIAYRSDRTGKVERDLRLFTRLQWNLEGRLERSGLVHRSRVNAPAFSVARARSALRAIGDGESSFLSSLLWSAPRIPGFKGDVYLPGDWAYRSRADQYATSSYPAESMTPGVVAYPLDEADVVAAIEYAKGQGKRVVARSGGHQYSGKSSGGADTLLLAMDAFDHFRDVTANTVELGPAVQLTELAAMFKTRGITIPHGECPGVCIGGHAQTGGYGHFLRAFGLTTDYVMAFRIVLADGSIRTVRRPEGAPATEDEELFWGVLGGNAGSFGIVTSYWITCIKDEDHPNAYGFTAYRKFEKARYAELMEQARLMSEAVLADSLPSDVDFVMTVQSQRDWYLPPVLLVEAAHSNLGGAAQAVDGDVEFQALIEASDRDAGPVWLALTDKGPKQLSDLADSFVRRFPRTTWDGREFTYPFKKRTNCSTTALTEGFVTRFVDLVDRIVGMQSEGVYLVCQIGIGGGNYRKSGRRQGTSMPHRDSVCGLSFDIFYDEGAEQKAVQLQDEMQVLIDLHFSPGREQRLFWGSFGDTDIAKPAIRDCYYNDTATYVRLQQLKQKVDPSDLFHTSLTVKLP